MLKKLKKSYYHMGGAIMTGLVLASSDAHAQQGNNTFSNIAENISNSIASIPGLITGLAYLLGLLLGVLGVLKIKDHVENPSGTPIKEGAIRLAAGGALFALPILFDAMFTTVSGSTGNQSATKAAKLNKLDFTGSLN